MSFHQENFHCLESMMFTITVDVFLLSNYFPNFVSVVSVNNNRILIETSFLTNKGFGCFYLDLIFHLIVKIDIDVS